MRGLTRLREARVFQRPLAWGVLLLLILANNTLWTPTEPLFGIAFAVSNCVMGVVFALHYKALSRLVGAVFQASNALKGG